MKKKFIDPVRLQFSVQVRRKRGVKIPAAVLERVIRDWMDGKPTPPGVKIDMVAWKNTDRHGKQMRAWRVAGNTATARRLLRGEAFNRVHETAEEARASLASITATQPISITLGGAR